MNNKITSKYRMADFELEQDFLEKQHAEGMCLDRVSGNDYYFNKCEIENYAYRIDYNANKKEHEEYICLFKDYGWDFILNIGEKYYFRKKILDTSNMNYEIFSDRESKVSLCKKIINNRLKYLISISFLLLLMFTLLSSILSFSLVVLCVVASAISFFLYWWIDIDKLNNIIENESTREITTGKTKFIIILLLSSFALYISIGLLLNLRTYAVNYGGDLEIVTGGTFWLSMEYLRPILLSLITMISGIALFKKRINKKIKKRIYIFILSLSVIALFITLKLFWNSGIYADEYSSSVKDVVGGTFWLYMDWLNIIILVMMSLISGIGVLKKLENKNNY